MELRPPEVVDATTSGQLVEDVAGRHVTIDLDGCRVFGADGYAWLGRLLDLADAVRIVGAGRDVVRLVPILVPAGLDEDGFLHPPGS